LIAINKDKVNVLFVPLFLGDIPP